MTCACGDAIASSIDARPAATISSASESSLVIRLEPALMSRVSLGPLGASPVAASQYARLSPSQQTVICSLVTTADTYVAAGAPSGPTSAVSARAAAWTAVSDAAAGSSPRC